MSTAFPGLHEARRLFGLGTTFSFDDVRRVYMHKARLIHPDKSTAAPATAHEEFVRLQAARATLLKHAVKPSPYAVPPGCSRHFDPTPLPTSSRPATTVFVSKPSAGAVKPARDRGVEGLDAPPAKRQMVTVRSDIPSLVPTTPPKVVLLATTNAALLRVRTYLSAPPSGYSPHEDQRQVLRQLCDSIRRGVKEIVVTGAAGTGKSMMIRWILEAVGQPQATIEDLILRSSTIEGFIYRRPTERKGSACAKCKAFVAEPFVVACLRCGAKTQGAAQCSSPSCAKLAAKSPLLGFKCGQCQHVSKAKTEAQLDRQKKELQWSFKAEPIRADYVIVDEGSMCKQKTADDLRARLPPHCVLIVVGDFEQLPPVGEPCGFTKVATQLVLCKVKRQASGGSVLNAATELRQRRLPFTPGHLGSGAVGLAVLRKHGVPVVSCSGKVGGAKTDAAMADVAAKAVVKLLQKDAKTDVAVIVSTHRMRIAVRDKVTTELGFARSGKAVRQPHRGFWIPRRGMQLLVSSTRSALFSKGTFLNVETCETIELGRYGKGFVLQVTSKDAPEDRRTVVLLHKVWRQTQWGTEAAEAADKKRKAGWPSLDRAKCSVCDNLGVAHRIAMRDPLAGALADKLHSEHLASTRQRLSGRDLVVRLAEQLLREKAEASSLVAAKWSSLVPIVVKTLAVDCDVGYATTCHSAQGSEIDKVVIVAERVDWICGEEARRANDYSDVPRWSYTALTRAKKAAMVVAAGA